MNLTLPLLSNFQVYELDVEPDGDDIQNALASWTGQRSVPNVFVGGKHIGGSDGKASLHSAFVSVLRV